ncbi:MAG: hypothetical protein HGA44_04010 [Cellulomonadaceae bacterium]|nr:hypothetical protein [Cellulomonadaceae bacterium]
MREVYANQLRTVANLQYVQSFEMRNNTGNVSYYMFHATRNAKGVQLMKDAMWKVDPGGDFTFSDRLAGRDVLFADEPDLAPLRAHLWAQFGGRGAVAAGVVKEHVALHTPFRPPHATAALKAMEIDGVLSAQRGPGQRRGTFAEGTPLVITAP